MVDADFIDIIKTKIEIITQSINYNYYFLIFINVTFLFRKSFGIPSERFDQLKQND